MINLQKSLWPLLVLGVCLFGRPMPLRAETDQEMFDRFTRESESALYRGPRMYLRIEALTQPQLMVGRNHSNFWTRLDSLLILKKHHLAKLSQEDIRQIGKNLDDENGRVREAAADLLGAQGSPGKEILRQTISATSNEKAVSASIGVLKNPTGFTEGERAQALQRLLDCLGRCNLDALNYLNNNRHHEALPWLKRTMFDESQPADVIKQVSDVFSHTAAKDDIPDLRKMVQSPNRSLRFYAVGRLREFLNDDIVRDLVEHANDPDDQVRHWIFLALSESGNTAALPVLRKGLSDRSEDVVKTSIEGVRKHRDVGALPGLVAILRGTDPLTPELTRTQSMAGAAISSMTGKGYEFGYGFLCGFPASSASQKVRAGKELGGEAGRKMIAEGTKELDDFRKSSADYVEKTDLKNSIERKKLLNWWDSDGSKKFKRRVKGRGDR